MDEFEAAWLLYPRKVAKHPARIEWGKLSAADRFAVIQSLPVHVRYWQAANSSPEFIPHFRTWLHQRRWEDELAMPQPKDEMGEWWKTTAGIQRKALSLGMTAKPGEDWPQLKARILAKERAA